MQNEHIIINPGRIKKKIHCLFTSPGSDPFDIADMPLLSFLAELRPESFLSIDLESTNGSASVLHGNNKKREEKKS